MAKDDDYLVNQPEPSAKEQQKPQAPEDRQGPKYDNDASGWVRSPGESAEGKPGFDGGGPGETGTKHPPHKDTQKWGRTTAQERYGRK